MNSSWIKILTDWKNNILIYWQKNKILRTNLKKKSFCSRGGSERSSPLLLSWLSSSRNLIFHIKIQRPSWRQLEKRLQRRRQVKISWLTNWENKLNITCQVLLFWRTLNKNYTKRLMQQLPIWRRPSIKQTNLIKN